MPQDKAPAAFDVRDYHVQQGESLAKHLGDGYRLGTLLEINQVFFQRGTTSECEYLSSFIFTARSLLIHDY